MHLKFLSKNAVYFKWLACQRAFMMRFMWRQESHQLGRKEGKQKEAAMGTMRRFTFVEIPCRVSKGFFDGELYVMIGTSTTDPSAYVDAGLVNVKEGPRNSDIVDGHLRVLVVDRKDNRVLVELPGEPVVGSRRAWVPEGQVRHARVP